MTKLLRFADLKQRGVVTNWVTLSHWVEREGFPPGRKLAANTRAWTEAEIGAWLDSRPAAAKSASTETEAA